MTGVIALVSIRQLLARGRTLLMGLLALVPILLAIVYRLGAQDTDQAHWVATVLLEGLIVTTLLPLAALVYGTAALGAEIEDGTAVYLLAKPVPRSRIVLAKLLAAWALTTATVVPSGVIAGLIGIAGAGNAGGLVPGFGVALVVGSLVYCALFVLLSIATSRALIAGLAYVFIWEGVVNGLFAGTRLLSVRHATLAIADALAGVPTAVFDAKLGIAGGVGLALILTIGGTLLAVRRLERFEIGDTT